VAKKMKMTLMWSHLQIWKKMAWVWEMAKVVMIMSPTRSSMRSSLKA
jgi:hypothetical protein